MLKKIEESIIDSFSGFASKIEDALRCSIDNLVWYRGCGRASYKLLPALYRHPKMRTSVEFLELENKILGRFKQRSLPYLQRPLQDSWENLFLMQHWGIPTRLLDWTENPYIALYFSLTDAYRETGVEPTYLEDAAFWILDPISWNRSVLRHISFKDTILSPQDEVLKGYAPSAEISLMSNDPIAMYGTHNSTRIVAQRGVFTIFGKNIQSMEEIFMDLNLGGKTLCKLIVPKARIAALLKTLIAIGITDSVVFPDMAGLAKETKRFFGYEV